LVVGAAEIAFLEHLLAQATQDYERLLEQHQPAEIVVDQDQADMAAELFRKTSPGLRTAVGLLAYRVKVDGADSIPAPLATPQLPALPPTLPGIANTATSIAAGGDSACILMTPSDSEETAELPGRDTEMQETQDEPAEDRFGG
jgi:hypothetical protein